MPLSFFFFFFFFGGWGAGIGSGGSPDARIFTYPTPRSSVLSRLYATLFFFFFFFFLRVAVPLSTRLAPHMTDMRLPQLH